MLRSLLTVVALLCLGAAPVVPIPDSGAVLHNPGQGLVFSPAHDHARDRAPAWYSGLVDVAYFRVDWSAVEPAEGEYRFAEVLGDAMGFWRAQGKRVALRIMSSNAHSTQRFVTPAWVFEAGVPGVEHAGVHGVAQLDPVFWHPVYIDKQTALAKALGRWLEGQAAVEFVDVGAMGEWGEGHLVPRWTEAELMAQGFTEARYLDAYLELVGVWREALPKTPLFVGCHTGTKLEATFVRQAVGRFGLGLRQDGLVDGIGADYPASGYFRRFAAQVPTQYELRHGIPEIHRREQTLRRTLLRGLADPVRYINLRWTPELAEASADDRSAVQLAARRVGHRLRPVEVRGGELGPTDLVFRNDGVAPPLGRLRVEVASVSGERLLGAIEETVRGDRLGPQKRWALRLELPPGQLRVRVTDELGRVLELPVGKRLEGGHYLLPASH